MKKMKILAAILFLSIGLAGCDVNFEKSISEQEKFAEVEKKLMAAVSDLTKIPTRVEVAAEPYIKGKIAVFQVLEDKGKYVRDKKDKIYFMQTSYFRNLQEIYAAAPEEVGTVALVDCRTLQKGVYTTNDGREMPAEVEDCELTLIDRSMPAVVFKKKFEKEPDDKRRVYANSVVRQTAQQDIEAFLKNLPRK
ncbi:MAG: hypothetical protein LH614_03860 [Pyrinomonadaceae bacterium]|nr:hypothetical protein [Pyrinomonadaceae bacterium]